MFRKAAIGFVLMYCISGYVSASVEDKTIKVAEKIRPSVVTVRCVRYMRMRMSYDPFLDNLLEEFFSQHYNVPGAARLDVGSGVIVDEKGLILTNEHVISGASEIVVTLTGGKEFNANVAAIDYKDDIAVLKIRPAEPLIAVPLGNSEDVKRGQWVIAAGNPFAFAMNNAEPTLTIGIVSALHRSLPYQGWGRTYVDLIQTDAAINPGNSGGPLVDLDGNVIGINVAILSTSGGSVGLGFAIPSNTAKRVLDSVRRGRPITYGWIGVYGQDITDRLSRFLGLNKPEGAFVSGVVPRGPADMAGIREGDVIVGFNGHKIRDMQDLIKYVSQAAVGEKAPVVIVRKGRRLNLAVVVAKQGEGFLNAKIAANRAGSSPNASPSNIIGGKIVLLGMALEEDSNGEVFVSEVEKGSPADVAGLLKGDVVLRINDVDIYSLKDVPRDENGNLLVKTQRGYFVIFRGK